MQRNERLDAARAQVAELGPVVLDGRFVETARLRLDPRPLHAEPVVPDAERLHQRGVLGETAVMVVGTGGRGAVADMTTARPFRPGMVHVAAFDLCGCAGNAETQAVQV